ncbi:MAG: hypothetical protein ABSD29_16915 [Verrucomicrobiota bacterium]|jgi:hypothetical protein
MERHDALRQLSPETAMPEPPAPSAKPKRSPKPPPLLHGLAEVTPESLAFLYGGPDQQPGDYQRNLARAEDIRRDFTTFCETHLHFANWRQAWSAFMAQRPPEVLPSPVPIPFPQPPSLNPQPITLAPAPPPWRRRWQAVAAVHG